ncbi:hypothetical protein COT75_01625 [Candidatus Beckwithbacteria bacterium CG10_big_fil_rev_8_21_14_0_10_34_10]|uniref:Glycosyltransferase RgtA/B/C/D-like domain-containing protein n=1 Tax=Candidatus Beckwithbacteria bacterium CG10_big_fil_rev_8_21_14_0_10_34_10 TaxID=1974495 RepID=A0A2H0W9P8_9BACT|nr:MAG: hypothetical protein COT75_01625 [Candidatus Beckwithbacteria bacterium CG10_big_fil_rev_8_21_14_0_10_34_10]
MIKKKLSWFWFDYLIFLLFFFFLFFKANGVLHGNEVSGIFYALFYRLNIKFLPSIFLYGHEPARGLIEIPFIFLGPNEFLLRLPSIIMALITFFVVKKTVKLLTNSHFIVTLTLLFYATSGVVILSRLTNGVSGFFLFVSLAAFYFLNFLKKENYRDLTKSLIYLFISLLFYIDSIFLLPGMGLNLFLKYKKKVLKKEIILPFFLFGVLFLLFIGLWSFIPYLAAKTNYINPADLKEFGFFRILARGGEGFNFNVLKSITVLNLYNHFLFSLSLLILFFTSFFDKWGKKYNLIFLFPLLYFSFHRAPTVHFLNFFPLIIIGASFGLKKLASFNKLGSFFLVLFLVLINLNFIKKFYFPEKIDFTNSIKGYYQNPQLFKAAGFIVRENALCREQVFSNLDSFVTLFYTGLPDKKNLATSDYALLFNDQLNKEEFNYSYQLKDEFNNYFNIYSKKELIVPSVKTSILAKSFKQNYHQSAELFPNIKCNNYK